MSKYILYFKIYTKDDIILKLKNKSYHYGNGEIWDRKEVFNEKNETF